MRLLRASLASAAGGEAFIDELDTPASGVGEPPTQRQVSLARALVESILRGRQGQQGRGGGRGGAAGKSSISHWARSFPRMGHSVTGRRCRDRSPTATPVPRLPRSRATRGGRRIRQLSVRWEARLAGVPVAAFAAYRPELPAGLRRLVCPSWPCLIADSFLYQCPKRFFAEHALVSKKAILRGRCKDFGGGFGDERRGVFLGSRRRRPLWCTFPACWSSRLTPLEGRGCPCLPPGFWG